MAAWGFSISDMKEEEIEVWEECWPAFLLFESMSTQWRVGMGGAIGLDYQTIPIVSKYIGLEHDMKQDVFQDLRIMENTALKIMSESKK
ncbi:hypothetical protein D3C78_900180 [compost metagenome]